MNDHDVVPSRSLSPAQEASLCINKVDAIEHLGPAPEQVEPCCTHVGLSSLHPHIAMPWKHATIAVVARRGRWSLALATGGLVTMGWAMFGVSPPKVVYNASNSVPTGWYRIASASALAVGDLVLVRLPTHAETLAAQRGYLPLHIPLLKPVAAVPPQKVCVQGNQVLVDGEVVARRLRRDRQGRALPPWHGCRRLAGDELFLLSTSNPESYDSRYYGPVSASAVIGRAQPLWLESRR